MAKVNEYDNSWNEGGGESKGTENNMSCPDLGWRWKSSWPERIWRNWKPRINASMLPKKKKKMIKAEWNEVGN